jgi:L-ribulokinase
MSGAVAAGKGLGGDHSMYKAAKAMAHLKEEIYLPISENQKVYEAPYTEYVLLHDYFGRGANDLMKRLKAIKADARR